MNKKIKWCTFKSKSEKKSWVWILLFLLAQILAFQLGVYIRPKQDASISYFPQKLSDKISDNWNMQLLHRGQYKALYTQNNSGNDENLQAFRGYPNKRIGNALLQRNKNDTNKKLSCHFPPKIQNKYIFLNIFLIMHGLKP